MGTVRKQVHQPQSAAPLALLFAAGLCAACEASDITLQGRTTLVVSPLQARLPLGETLRLRAIANGPDTVTPDNGMARGPSLLRMNVRGAELDPTGTKP